MPPSLDRRALLVNSGLALLGTTLLGTRAEAGTLLGSVQRELMMEMAAAYELRGDKQAFKDLNDVMSGFRAVGDWPSTPLVVSDAMGALQRVLAGESLDRQGFRRVRTLATNRLVVFSDHHILPDANRQSGVWRKNRAAYARILSHYGDDGWIVAENGDVEDLVILEPAETVASYQDLLDSHRGRSKRIRSGGIKTLQDWFRDNPDSLIEALDGVRLPRRQRQFDAILNEPANQPYYDVLASLAATDQLVRLAGNHDYNLQELEVPAHLVPHDILIATGDKTVVAMHGHQFDEATNPGVARLYGEVISECAGVWYQGPDRLWDSKQVKRILSGGYPNRLATHGRHGGGGAGAFLSAIMASKRTSDDDWAAAWESIFGHPIAWEYGAEDWEATVRGAASVRPGKLIDDAMLGRQFFKFRHLDEVEIVDAMLRWRIEASLVLGHSHEVRDIRAGPVGRYYNSGAAGRFEGLIWALEMEGDRVEVVGWHIEDEKTAQRYRFTRREADLFSYFEVAKAKEVV